MLTLTREADPYALLGVRRLHEPLFKAVYDPVTGLALVREPVMSAMWACHVDTDRRTEVDHDSISASVKAMPMAPAPTTR